MSKLSTLLRRAGRSEPAPMGFATMTGRAKSAEMLLGASLGTLEVDAAIAAAKGGANLLFLENGDLLDDAAAIKAITGAVEIPCGLRLNKPVAASPEEARVLGLDYLRIEDHDTPAVALLDEEMGFVLSIVEGATDTALRLLESMSFDAIYAGEVSQPFTLRRQLELRRISGFAHKPLVLRVQDALSSAELECLRDSGVAAVIAEVGGRSSRHLATLRSEIEAMRPRRRRRNEQSTTAMLPSVAHASDDADDEDD